MHSNTMSSSSSTFWCHFKACSLAHSIPARRPQRSIFCCTTAESRSAQGPGTLGPRTRNRGRRIWRTTRRSPCGGNGRSPVSILISVSVYRDMRIVPLGALVSKVAMLMSGCHVTVTRYGLAEVVIGERAVSRGSTIRGSVVRIFLSVSGIVNHQPGRMADAFVLLRILRSSRTSAPAGGRWCDQAREPEPVGGRPGASCDPGRGQPARPRLPDLVPV